MAHGVYATGTSQKAEILRDKLRRCRHHQMLKAGVTYLLYSIF